MKLKLRGLWVLVLILCIVPIVSAADTCSFINITTGPQGIPGINGTSCNITINSTVSGTPASVTNIGTENNAIFDFVIPPGEVSSYNSTYDAYTNYNATYDAKPDSTYNATYDSFTNYNASYITSTYNATYDAKPDSTYNATYDAYSTPDTSEFLFRNGSRAMTGIFQMGGFNISNLLNPVSAQDAATKNYVDTAISGISNYNSTYNDLIRTDYVYTGNTSYLLGSNTSIATTTLVTNTNTSMKNYVDATNISMKNYVDALPSTNYNASYVEYSNTSYALDSEVSAVNTSMKNYVDAEISGIAAPDTSEFLFLNGSRAMTGNLSMGSMYINNLSDPFLAQDAATKKYVDDNAGSSYNATYDAFTNYNATYDAFTNYNASYITSTFNSTYDAKPDSTYNATYDAKPDSTYNATYDALTGITNYNASYVEHSNTSYFLTDGSRTMLGNITFTGNFYINDLTNPSQAQDAATKDYVDTAVAGMSNYNESYLTSADLSGYATEAYVGEQGFITSTYNATYDAKADSNYNASYITSTFNSTYDAKPDSNYNASYWTGTNYNETYDALIGGTNYNATYDVLIRTDYVYTDNTSYLLATNTSVASTTLVTNTNTSMKNYVDASNTSMKNYVDTGLPYVASNNGTLVLTSNTSYLLGSNTSIATTTLVTNTNASMKNYVDATNTSMKNYVDAGLPYVASTNTSLVLTTNGSYVQVTNTSYVKTNNASYVLTNNGSYILGTNTSYVLTNNATYVKNPVYGYVTLMAGSAMMTTTNPSPMNQWETATNKNNYITMNFTDGGSENAQWIVDMPGDWDSADADDGKLTFTFLWTGTTGSGTVKWDIAGKLFPDDAAIDTALAAVGTATDTYITAYDMHVSPDTTAAVVTSVGTGGRAAIFKVTRDSGTDTYTSTAQLIGVRVKYIRTLAG